MKVRNIPSEYLFSMFQCCEVAASHWLFVVVAIGVHEPAFRGVAWLEHEPIAKQVRAVTKHY